MLLTNANNRPADFGAYWSEALEELALYPIRPELELMPIRSTDFATMYGVRLTGVGPYRLFAYLSIPGGQGPFPAIYYVARYGSVVEPIPQGTANLVRSRFVTLSIGARGQRNADRPYAALFPGMLTEGIDRADSYIFRGVAADCARGLEFLLGRPEVDQTRVVAVGNDLSLIAAALADGISHVVCAPALFYRTAALAPKTSAYPLEEVNDYLRAHPDARDGVHRTLAYFDPRWFALRVGAATLISAEPSGGLVDREALGPLVEAMPGDVAVHESERSSYRDGLFVERWIARQCGFDEPILPEHWQ